MKALLSFLLLTAATWTHAASFTLAWDPTFGASQYVVRLTLGTNSTVFVTPNLAMQFTNLSDGVAYTVNVTGQSVDGLSGPTSTNKIVALPGQPNNLRVSMLFESAPEPPGPWQVESNIVIYVADSAPNRFFRGRMQIERAQ